MKMTDSCRPHFFWQQLPLLVWGIAAGCLGLFLVCCAGSSWADGSFLLLLLLLSMLDIRYGLLFDRLLLVLAETTLLDCTASTRSFSSESSKVRPASQ